MIKQSALEAAQAHAIADFPNEAVGVVVRAEDGEKYITCRNVAKNPTRDFVLSGEDYANAEDMGDVIAIMHSHPNGVARASHVDRMICEESGVPWGIIALGGDPLHLGQTAWIQPEGWEPPLVGREFVHGVLDCYTLVRDYYKREMGIELPNFERADKWWDKKSPNYRPGEGLYLENFASAGFVEATGRLQKGDIILMQVLSDVPNHAGIFIGEPDHMLHHMYGRLSERVVYGGQWTERTRKIIRRAA